MASCIAYLTPNVLVLPFPRSVCEDAMTEHRQEMAERAARERAEVSASRERVSRETVDTLVAEVTMEMGQAVAEEEGR